MNIIIRLSLYSYTYLKNSPYYKVDINDKNFRRNEICNVPSAILFGYGPCLYLDKKKLLDFGVELKDYSCEQFMDEDQIIAYEYNDYCGDVIVPHDEL